MQHEVGSIIEGKVTGITKFGAFVELEGGGTGMVHISEISQSYVNDIADYLKEGDAVKVKVLNVGPDGKISLSIKRALPPDPNQAPRPAAARPGGFNGHPGGPARPGGGAPRPGGPPRQGGYAGSRPPQSRSGGFGGGPRGGAAPKEDPFESMLSRFMKQSDDKISDMKQPERRRGYKKDSRDYD